MKDTLPTCRYQFFSSSMTALPFPHIRGAVCLGSCWGCRCVGTVYVVRKTVCSPSTALHCTSPFCMHSTASEGCCCSDTTCWISLWEISVSYTSQEMVQRPHQMLALLVGGLHCDGYFNDKITVQKRSNVYIHNTLFISWRFLCLGWLLCLHCFH